MMEILNNKTKFKIGCFLLCLLLFIHCSEKSKNLKIELPAKAIVPSTILHEHQKLLGEIENLYFIKDSARSIKLKTSILLKHHFKEEEDLLLAQLGLLPFLVRGENFEPGK
jgi:hypothetical protein